MCVIGVEVQLLQYLVVYVQGVFEGFVFQYCDVMIYQVVVVCDVVCMGGDLQVWEFFVYFFYYVQCGLCIVDGDYQDFGFVGIGGVQQVDVGGIVIEYFEVEFVQEIDLVWVVIQYCGIDVIGCQQMVYDLVEMVEVGDDDFVVLWFDFVFGVLFVVFQLVYQQVVMYQ